MSKILILGFPLPSGNDREIVQARNIRALQFVEALAGEGHELIYAAKPQPHFDHRTNPPGVHHYVELDFTSMGWRFKLRSLIRKIQPVCLVTTDFFASYAATFLNLEIPCWMDINGDPEAEKQAILHRQGMDRGVLSIPSIESRVLRAGDRFSVASTPQRYALIGKLGCVGRLNARTFAFPLVHSIPPAVVSFYRRRPQSPVPLIRGRWVKQGDFVLLWAGGYNAWTDVQTLFQGLSSAMKEDPAIRFVSTGGPVVNDRPYQEFRRMVEQSPSRERFLFMDWIPRSELLQLYEESDCGISLDADCYETELGARNRLLDMAGNGLLIIASEGPEISFHLAREGFGRLFRIGDATGLSKRILEAAFLKKSGSLPPKEVLSGRALGCFGVAPLSRPLVEWARDPTFSPDRRTISRALRMKAALRGMLRDWRAGLWGVNFREPEDLSAIPVQSDYGERER